jgi:hypothetical protein
VIYPLTIPAGQTRELYGVRAFRNLTAPAGSTVKFNSSGEPLDLGSALITRYAPNGTAWAVAKFTAGARDLVLEIGDSYDDEFDGSASGAPPAPPGWEFIEKFDSGVVPANAAVLLNAGGLIDCAPYTALRMNVRCTLTGGFAFGDAGIFQPCEIAEDGDVNIMHPLVDMPQGAAPQALRGTIHIGPGLPSDGAVGISPAVGGFGGMAFFRLAWLPRFLRVRVKVKDNGGAGTVTNLGWTLWGRRS